MGERLKQLRKALKITQGEMGEKLNLTQGTITAYENNLRTVTDRTIADICRIWNVNEDWLRTGEGEMFLDLSDVQTIDAWCADVLKLPKDSPKRKILNMLANIPEEDWTAIEDIINHLK